MGTLAAQPLRFPGRYFLQNLVERRTLLAQLVRRDFEKRFVGSAAGWVWGVIHPLVLLLSWTFVFDWCLKVRLGAREVTQNYTIFLFCGFLPWLLLQDTVQRSATSLLENATLITKTVFPSEIVPLSVFLSSLIHHLIGVALAVAAIAIWLNHFGPMILMLPVYMALVGLLAVGIGWVVAALQVYVRDTAQVLVVVLTLWFWTTPIFIPEEQYPAQLRFLIAANPMAYVVRGYREALLSYRLPEPQQLAIVAIYAVAAFFLGGLFFRRLKRGFADVL
ncbi:MAG TPA: ABC transporter permease [Bryobacteraceae bacterium]|nr:ABC transporter permease [Bryobacteraceae bacterium]